MQLRFLIATLCIALSPLAPQADLCAQSVSPLAGLPDGLASMRNYKTMRVSSEDRTGNADMRRIEPGATLTLAELTGPGEITHFWTTIATEDPNHLRNIVFRIYWDGNDFPSVESPIGDFYGLGLNRYYIFDNPMQAIGTDKGMNCFWPMPFNKSARITATNEGDKPVNAFYYYVNYKTFDTPQEGRGYFHAQYRQAKPTPEGERYLIMETDGGAGHFVGVNMSIHTQSGGWWGEGDDVFTIDGETTPTLWGTGSEDYFCGAWCYGKTFYNNYFGMPLREKEDHSADNFWNVYRLHLEMPITYKKSLKVEMEHGHDGVSGTRKPRNNDHSSVAYWYVDTPRPLKGTLPPAADRQTNFNPMPVPEGHVEFTFMKANIPTGVVSETQNMDPYVKGASKWVNSDQLFLRNMEPGKVVSVEFETTVPMSGSVEFGVTKAPDYGKVKLSINDKQVATYDGYAQEVISAVIQGEKIDLPAGKHTIKIEGAGKSSSTTNNFVGLDFIRTAK